MPTLDSALLDSLNAAQQSRAREAQAVNQDLGQEQFFELMLAQLKNQDPTKPLDGQDFVAQLAQFSAVSGITGLQQSFDALAASMQSVNALQASSLVGRSVLIDSDRGWLGEEGALAGAVTLDENVNGLAVGVYDSAGRLLRRLELGSHGPGAVAFAWDGRDASGARAAPGVYTLRAEGQIGAKSYGFPTRVQAPVHSVSLDPGGRGVTLNLDGLGARSLGDVLEIL